MKNIKSLIALICLVSISQSLNLKSQVSFETKQAHNIFITVDNNLDEFLVNGTNVLPVGNLPNADNWQIMDSFYHSIAKGDTISISGHNTGGPNAMLFSIHYQDENGNQQILNSGEGWTCDGLPAVTQGTNGVYPWGNFQQIESNAVWIWSNSSTRCTCTYTIPAPVPIPTNGC